MPSIGRRCHELRIHDVDHSWRIVLRIDPDAIVILEIFDKKTRKTPGHVIEACRHRLRRYDSIEP
jgi:phage-related protein